MCKLVYQRTILVEIVHVRANSVTVCSDFKGDTRLCPILLFFNYWIVAFCRSLHQFRLMSVNWCKLFAVSPSAINL